MLDFDLETHLTSVNAVAEVKLWLIENNMIGTWYLK